VTDVRHTWVPADIDNRGSCPSPIGGSCPSTIGGTCPSLIGSTCPSPIGGSCPYMANASGSDPLVDPIHLWIPNPELETSLPSLLLYPPFPFPSLPLEVAPLNTASGCGEHCKLPHWCMGADPLCKSNLVHFSLKI